MRYCRKERRKMKRKGREQRIPTGFAQGGPLWTQHKGRAYTLILNNPKVGANGAKIENEYHSFILLLHNLLL